jgi:hypothetical protein
MSSTGASNLSSIPDHYTVQKKQKGCSNPVFFMTVITTLALMILGALALAGLVYPGSSLGALGSAFGPMGALSILGAGIVLLAASIVARFACNRKKAIPGMQYSSLTSPQTSNLHTSNAAPGGDRNGTGAGGGGPPPPPPQPQHRNTSGHSNAYFG